MIFVLKMLFTFVYDLKNENHWSLFITHYSLLGIQTPNCMYSMYVNLKLENRKTSTYSMYNFYMTDLPIITFEVSFI